MTAIILAATDLSARCDRAVERALLLGRQLGAPVSILHVREDAGKLSSQEQERLRALMNADFGLEGQAVEICFAHGPVPSTIAKFADERDCALIVTGVARFNDLRDFVLGTAVDYLVRESSRPVLVVRRRARRPYERLVVATDFSPTAASALAASAALFPKARIRLVHAYQAAFEAFLDHDSTAPTIRAEAEEQMEHLIAELPEGLRSRVETFIEEGRPATILPQNVSEFGNELLVLGTWHKRRHAHVMGSEDASTVPAREPCDVLIVGKAAQQPRIQRDALRLQDKQGIGSAGSRVLPSPLAALPNARF